MQDSLLREIVLVLGRTDGAHQVPSGLLARLLPSCTDLAPCGRPALLLHERARYAAERGAAQAIDLSDYILRLSDERILSFPYTEVPTCWRCLYTDASLLAALSRIRCHPRSPDALLEAIEKLDMALVVAGAPGHGRLQLIHRLIPHIQTMLPTSDGRDGPSRKRRKLDNAITTELERPSIERHIPRLDVAPTLDTYTRQYIDKPFIISGGAAAWPALVERPWSSPSYLQSVAGPGRVVPVEVGGTYTMSTWSQTIMPFAQFLASIGLATDDGVPNDMFYLAQHDLFHQLPQLKDDIIVPDYLYSAPPAPPEMPGYVPPDTDTGYILNAWLGPAGTNSPPHTDPYYNCFVQVVGKKWIWVAPPSVSKAMYAFGHDANESGTTSYMTNTSQIDVSKPFSDSDRRHFPMFVEQAQPVAMQTILEPGDMLVMPPGWWHSLKSLSVSFSVSMWYALSGYLNEYIEVL